MEEKLNIVHGLTPDEIEQTVKEEVGEFPLSYDLFYARMQRRLRITGAPLESAIRNVFLVDGGRRITGLKPLPPEDLQEE